MARCAFLGLGVMGGPMAGHLARAGHDVTVWNRTSARALAWVERYGAQSAATIQEAVRQAEFVFACVGNDSDLASVADPALDAMPSDAVFVDHTTASAAIARRLAHDAQRLSKHFIDAPVSGGQAGAENGRLTVMAGGAEAAFVRAQPVMGAFATNIVHVGPSGSGQLTKMVNQICIAGVVQGLSEGLHFAQQAGLDVETVIAAISKGAAQSWQMDNRWRTMQESRFDFGFAVDWMRKDLGLVLDEARANGARLPLAALVDQFYAEVQAMGGGRHDTSSLIARLRRAP